MTITEREIKIPETLYKKVEKFIEGSGFDSVSQFIIYVVREFISNMEATGEPLLSEQDKEKILEKLKNLGYI